MPATTRPTRRRRRLVLGVLTLAVIGCAGVPAIRTPTDAGPSAVVADDVLVRAADVYDRGPGETDFQSDDGRRLRRVVHPRADDGSWRVELRDLDANNALRRTVVLAEAGDTIEMRALMDHTGAAGKERQRTRVDFEPGIRLLPPVLGADGFETETEAVLTRGSSVTAGTATRRVELIGSEPLTLHTDAGEGATIDATCIESTLDLRFGATRVLRTERVWVHPDRGLVADAASVYVTFAGVPVRRESTLNIAYE